MATAEVHYADPTASAYNSDDYSRGYNAGVWASWDGHALEGMARDDYDRGYDDGLRVHSSMVAREARAALAREDERISRARAASRAWHVTVPAGYASGVEDIASVDA